MRPLRLLALLALPFCALAACDSNNDSADKACYSRKDAADACFSVTDTVVGTGTAPDASNGDSVFVRYVGRVSGNGNAEFDRGAFGFPLRKSAVVAGFYYGIAGATSEDLEGISAPILPMNVGGKRTVNIPAELAYGDQEIRGTNGYVLIPRNSDLVFEIELTAVHPRLAN